MLSSRLGLLACAATSILALAACQNQAPPAAEPMAQVAPAPAGPPSTEAVLAQADPDMKKVLDALQSLDPKPIESLTPTEARLQPTLGDAVKIVMQQSGMNTAPEQVASTKDMKVAPGGQMVRIYTPKGRGPFPVVVYYHGGGFVLADINTYDASARAIANAADAIVVSAEYRHAPEAKFPAAHDDAFTAYKWVLSHARTFGGDPNRVAVAGESAGGNLAVAVSTMARDAKVKLPVYAVAIYPVAGSDMNTPSYIANTNAKPLNKAMMAWFFDKYANTPEDAKNPLIDLVGSANLSGLEPMLVITDQIDPLMSEGKALADKLQAAGVPVTYQNYDGVTHEFFGAGPAVAKSKQAQALVGEQLQQAFKAVVPARAAATSRGHRGTAARKPA